MTSSSAGALKRVPFLSHLDDGQLEAVLRLGTLRSIEAETVLFREGDPADGMYVVLSGTVRVSRRDDQGTDRAIGDFGAGEFFGEAMLLEGGTRAATITSVAPCELFILDSDGFASLVQSLKWESVKAILSTLTLRLRTLGEQSFRRELARQAQQAEMEIARHRNISEMVAGVAHEVNTPLGIIATGASIIQSRIASSEMKALSSASPEAASIAEDLLEASSLIQRSLQRAQKLVQDFKKVAVNQVADERMPVDLVATVEETITLFALSAKKSRIEVELRSELAPEERTWVGYPGALSQVLLNLFSNVQRYAYGDSGGRVDVLLRKAAGRLEIIVRDFGAGIAPEHLPRIFDAFFSTGRSRGGSGLGLAIVWNLVTGLLKGEVSVESERARGTTFRISLPLSSP
jgi:signal transduction histidine kinase